MFTKIFKYIIFSAILIVSFYSCKNSKCFKSAGTQVCEIRTKANNYNKIEINGKLNVSIKNDSLSNNEIIVEGGKNLTSFVKTEINNNVLYIDNTNKCTWLRSYKKSKIDVSVPQSELNYLKINGHGTILSTDTITSDSLEIEFSTGISDVDLITKAGKINIVIHDGAGDMKIKGKSDQVYIYNNGYLYLDLSELTCNYMFLANKSQNKTFIRVKNRLDIEIYDVGTVYCYGNPQVVNIKKYGEGKLVMAE